MSLGLMMHGNWDGLSMAPPQLQSYKPERPVYSTPHPVQSTPANNECKLVELRGAEVASFLIGDEEYICLPQAFDLFLKHLVGGLHTVYTKLKRLNITPVVCNVEQVRVLRGLGAIQPGVNRCKLITRKDFEVLYQDCTTASRPGRPPKRFPILPPSELMSHHHGARAMNPPRLHNSPDLSSFYKRMRMDPEANFHQQQPRRISTSPTRRSSPTARTSGADELYANAANIYLQQALRQQYQQFIANGLHNNMNAQHGPMNAALAPLIGMSNHGLFNGAIPPNLLNHINEYARANGREIQNSSMNSEGHRSAAASPREEKAENPDKYRSPEPRNSSLKYEPPMDGGLVQRIKSPAQEDRSMKSPHHRFDTKVHDSRHSPVTPNSMTGRNSVGGASVSSYDSGKKSPNGQTYNRGIHSPRDDSEVFHTENMTQAKYDVVKEEQEKIEAAGSPIIDNRKNNWQASPEGASISSMQTLLSNIQGLLKVAADNAKLQDKQLSFEIAELKNRITKEQELRGMAERKLEESEKIRASIQRKLNREREAVKRLQERKLAVHEKLQHIDGTDKPSDVDVTSSPSEPRSEPCSPASNTDALSGLHLQADSTIAVPTSMESNMSSEFSPVASSPSAVSPASVNECLSYWPTRPLALDTSSQRNRSASHSPEHTSPVNMATAERNWMSHSLVQSSSCAK